MEAQKEKQRYYIIDIIRAIAIINMIAYHFMFDLHNFGLIKGFFSPPMNVWQQCICITFIFISGFSFQLGRKQWKRGLIILGCAAVLSLATHIMDLIAPRTRISFGILCFMASAMLVTIPIHMLLKKLKYAHWVGFFVSILIFIFIHNINKGTIIFGSVTMPKALYSNYLTAYLGFPNMRLTNGFFSADYFPILPWLFLYLTGYFAFSIFKQLNLLKYLTKIRIKPLEFIGKHTLPIYMAHQVILFPIAYIIMLIVS